MGLVTHLPTVLDPVTEIDGLQAQSGAFADLPEDGETTQAAAFFIGVVKGVNRRKTVGQHIGDGDGEQALVQA
ncbi:hypothetical protein D3C85_1905430 [compost metagenome]